MSRLRDSFGFQIETAGPDPESQQYRVRGWMNTFAVTHSRRLLHPRGFQNWLTRTGGKQRLPMLANHGLDVGGFASIGKWDRFEFHEGKGMLWSGYIGQGTPAADQARTLLDQRILDQLSVGWVPLQARLVTLKDADLDPLVKAAMEEAGVEEVRAYLDWYPVEGSVVDVADDPGARIAARLEALEERLERALPAGGRDGESAELMAAVRALAERVETLAKRPVEVDSSGLRTMFKEFLEAFKADALEVFEAVAADPHADYAAALLAADADATDGACGAHGGGAAPQPATPAEELLNRLRAQPL